MASFETVSGTVSGKGTVAVACSQDEDQTFAAQHP